MRLNVHTTHSDIKKKIKSTEPELVSSREDRKKDHCSSITPLSYCYNKKQSHKQKLLINIHFLLLWLLGLLIISISWISSVVHARVLRSSSRITIILITLGISIVSSIPLVWVWLSLHTNRNPKSISWIQGHHTKKNQKMHQIIYRTCLFEGLRPHDSRIFCPPN